MLEKLNRWLLGLIVLLGNQLGEEDGSDSGTAVIDTDDDTDDTDDTDDNDDGDDADVDSGNNDGKDRSKYIPRERFDQVNSKAQKLEKLQELGILVEDESGEFRINPDVINPKKDSDQKSDKVNYRFAKDEVDDASWPLVQKINQAYDHYDRMANQFAHVITQLQSENAILRDYPDFLQKESPLRKTAMEILRSDPEFKKTYKNNPERGYWAVKRAFEKLSGKQSMKPKKKKSSFITGRGDGGKSTVMKKPIGSLTKDELDELERAEHQRYANTKKVAGR